MKLSIAKYILFIVCLVISSFALPQDIYVDSLDKPTDISGLWKYKIGDDINWANSNFDDSQWQEIPVPQDWGKFGLADDFNYLWYRLHINFDRQSLKQEDLGRLAIGIGKVFSAYEIYANGI